MAGPESPSNPLSRRGFLSTIGTTSLGLLATTSAATASRTPDVTSRNTKLAARPAFAQNSSSVTSGPTIGLEPVATGLTFPVGLRTAPESRDRLFVIDMVGQLHVLTGQGRRNDPFLDVTDRVVELGNTRVGGEYDERGLLGVDFHPDFEDDGRLFVRYSAPPPEDAGAKDSHTLVLSEFQTTDDRSRALPDTERRLIEIPKEDMGHNAGDLGFGPDGYLYIPLGDGFVHSEYGQDIEENLLGSVLRIDIDSRTNGKPYGIPDDNPLLGEDGLDEQYAWGFRNPWRMSFDDGRLFVADAGTSIYEEVNLVEKGGNYGWALKEGTACNQARCPATGPAGHELRDPALLYDPNGQVNSLAVVGGYVYRGDLLPDLQGAYVFGDWSSSWGSPAGTLLLARQSDDEEFWPIEIISIADSDDGLGRFVLGFGRDEAGEVYLCSTTSRGPVGDTGTVHRLVPPGGVPTDTSTPTGTATPSRTPTFASETATATSSPTVTDTSDSPTDPTDNGVSVPGPGLLGTAATVGAAGLGWLRARESGDE